MTGLSVCGQLWLAFGVIWLVWGLRTKPVQRRESSILGLSHLVLTVAAFFVIVNGDLPFPWLYLRIVPRDRAIAVLGIVLTAAGLLFAIWARAYLGGNWSGSVTVKVGHQLVRTGPYRWVRHPIYSGLILALIGTALNRGEVHGLVAVLLLYAGFLMKSKIEDRFMAATFGQEYQEYSQATGAMVPRLRP